MDEEERKIRHTISAEETFTLAKDVFDIRTFVKNVYANRAIIARRINIITLCVGLVYTILYVAFTLYNPMGDYVSSTQQIVVYSITGAYVLTTLVLFIFVLLSSRATTRSLKKFTFTLRIIRIILRLISISMSIVAISITVAAGTDVVHFAVQLVIILLSIITIAIQCIPLLFGGTGKFVRWLLSPVKIKMRFSAVVLEWYELAITGEPTKGSSAKVAKKHYEKIGNLIDGTLVPALGKKYINTIKPTAVLNLVDSCPEEDRPVLEGVLKSVFAYATECGYVIFDPCRDLNLEGSVEEQKKRSVKDKLLGIGTKFGKRMFSRYMDTEEDDN